MKRSIFILRIGCALVLWFALSVSGFAQANDQFAKANQEFAQGKFKEAAEDYEGLVRAGDFSANLFYDLGNAYFRLGNFGHAILNYERALALDPRHPEALANLRVARDEARALELPQGWAERLLQYANLSQCTVAASIAFWLGVFVMTARIFARRRSPGLIALALALLFLSALLGYAIFSIDQGSKGRSLAIVTARDVNARLATADNAGIVLTLPSGSEVKIIRQRGDWVYAALPNNLQGWIPARSLESVRL